MKKYNLSKVEGTINMNKDYLFLSKVACGKNRFVRKVDGGNKYYDKNKKAYKFKRV